MSVGVTRTRENPRAQKADEPTGSVTKTRSVSASPSLHLGDNGAETKAHLLFSLGAHAARSAHCFYMAATTFLSPARVPIGFLCCCCGAFSLAVVASKINILLMLAREIHCLKAATCFATAKSPLVILCTRRAKRLWMKNLRWLKNAKERKRFGGRIMSTAR